MRKLRISIAVAAALAVMLGIWSATASADTGPRYAVAAAGKGSVQQEYLTVGTVSRVGAVESTFSVSGTVSSVSVKIGDSVAVGDVLAKIDSAGLKLAVLDAESDLADAEASLYSAEHPSSGSGGRAAGAAGAAGLADLAAGLSGVGSGGAQQPSALNPAQDDLQQLYTAIAETTRATAAWSTADNPDAEPTLCDKIYAALEVDPADPDPTDPTDPADPADPAGSDPSGADPAASPASSSAAEPSSDPGPSSDPEPEEPQPAPAPAEDADPAPEPSSDESAVALSVTAEDITLEQLQACGEARGAVVMANAVLADYYNQLLTTGVIEGSASPDQPGIGAKTPSAKASSGSGSGSTSVSEAQVAQAEVSVLQAQQRLDEAKASLAKATLKASVSGTVGALTLVAGGSSSGSVTIVGDGAAELSFELPLAVRQLAEVGGEVSASPAGSTDSLDGLITSISQLETSGTAGDKPTYTVVALVDDPDQALADGSTASIRLIVRAATDVVTVPASSVVITGSGEGTVSVVESAEAQDARETPVKLGAQGQGLVEITSGLDEGELVVLADSTEPLPSN
ncbi:MAG: efflux RND transporter periplasmic adaptor subunit [Propionibacteriaceae bacterium]|jgi:multidrug efflux pump subunit AcrA (membrane-fusion protein)|nr:efflux RND transporter periplasmic adaptor subunit [Propionibacteriaceae bacterium]